MGETYWMEHGRKFKSMSWVGLCGARDVSIATFVFGAFIVEELVWIRDANV